jgi:hypothetical protein
MAYGIHISSGIFCTVKHEVAVLHVVMIQDGIDNKKVRLIVYKANFFITPNILYLLGLSCKSIFIFVNIF